MLPDLFLGQNLTQNLLLLNIHLWRRQWHPTPVLLPGKSHGRRSLVGYSPWGRQELDMTEQLHFLSNTYLQNLERWY